MNFMGKAIGLFFLLGVMSMLVSMCSHEPNKSSNSSTKSYDSVIVSKKDGSYDSRPNDLEELCKDYLYYRNQIVKRNAAGDQAGATKARQTFQQINSWLSEYPNSEVEKMFSKLEQAGYRAP